jgi:hypothetical protein
MHMKRQVLFVQGGGEGVHDDWERQTCREFEVRAGAELRDPLSTHAQ